VRVDLFDFDLPEESIALRPASPRDSAKLLVVNDGLEDHVVRELPDFLRPGDVLVFNDTKVIPTLLEGVRIRDGVTANVSAMLHTRISSDRWFCFVKGAKKLKAGDRIRFGVGNVACGSLDCGVMAKYDNGDVEVQFDLSGAAFDQKLAQVGSMPLPPYIASKRGADAKDV